MYGKLLLTAVSCVEQNTAVSLVKHLTPLRTAVGLGTHPTCDCSVDWLAGYHGTVHTYVRIL